ncbi:MAG: anti-sigma factor family protein [Opitutales bacterium]
MHIQPDDPRLTAYALGELDDPAEVQAIEAALQSDPQLQSAVDAIRSTAQALETAFAAETQPAMTPAEKAVLSQPQADAAAAAAQDPDAPGILTERVRGRLPSATGKRTSRKVISLPLLITAAAAAVAVLLFGLQRLLENPPTAVVAQQDAASTEEEVPESVNEAADSPEGVSVTTRAAPVSESETRELESMPDSRPVSKQVIANFSNELDAEAVGELAPLNVIVVGPEVFQQDIRFDGEAFRPEWGSLGGLGPQLAEATRDQRPVLDPVATSDAPTIVAGAPGRDFFASRGAAVSLRDEGSVLMTEARAESSDLLAPDNDAALALGVRQRALGEARSGTIVAVVPPAPVSDLETGAQSSTSFGVTAEASDGLAAAAAIVPENPQSAPSTVTNRFKFNNASRVHEGTWQVAQNLSELQLSTELAGKHVRVYLRPTARPAATQDLKKEVPAEPVDDGSLLELFEIAGSDEAQAPRLEAAPARVVEGRVLAVTETEVTLTTEPTAGSEVQILKLSRALVDNVDVLSVGQRSQLDAAAASATTQATSDVTLGAAAVSQPAAPSEAAETSEASAAAAADADRDE